MSQRGRLPDGGRIDRTRTLRFQFDGRSYEGHPGDTLASALLANGVHLVGRSFKYHRPRGVLSAGAEEPNALIQLRTGARMEPNCRATMVELFDGLVAATQNRWPSVRHDLGQINDLVSYVLPVGFYNKTFMWPPGWWPFYERWIRKAAGLGQVATAPDPDRYDHRNAHCDVLVVGAGPAGLAAALAAGRAGATVLLADEQAELGGSLLADDRAVDDASAADWVRTAVEVLAAMAPRVTVLPRTTVTGYYHENFLTALQRVTDHLAAPEGGLPRQRLWKIRSKQVVLATGAIERPLVFANNDRPGVMLAGAARSYVTRYGVLPGRRAVVFTNNDSAYPTAFALRRAGAAVTVVDMRAGSDPRALREAGIDRAAGHGVVAVRGRSHVRAVQVAPLRIDGGVQVSESFEIPADLVAMSGGWSPTIHLFSQSGGKTRYDAETHMFLPGDSRQALRCAGACQGQLLLVDCLREGALAGASAAGDAGFRAVPETPSAEAEPQDRPMPAWVIAPDEKPQGKQFVDFQNDVTLADLRLAAREGYVAVEHLKRYTTTGMGTDQGKTSNVNALAVLAEIRDAAIPEVGHTTFRPPYTPVTLGAMVGRNLGWAFDPARRTPMHDWHAANGAVFEDVGPWKRPHYYDPDGVGMAAAVDRECLAVRQGVGMLDASTLGKIDIRGPDAAAFLERIYPNRWSTLKVGRCRYGVMLNEQGMIFDDGVTTRLAEDHFHMTTTTGGAAHVLDWLEEWLQTEWPDTRVYCTSVTEQWAVAALAGPESRAVLAKLCDDIRLDDEAFPLLTMRSGHVAGIPARVFRISFSGALSYEVNVPARYGLALWEALMAAGADFDIWPYGTEAMHVLRAEKGFIIVGQETDGTVAPEDVGLGWMLAKKDFIGRRSLSRTDTARADRKQLVGLETAEPTHVLPEGVQLVMEADGQPPLRPIGHVTSSYHSAALGRSIALGLVARGRSRHGETLYAALMTGERVPVTVCDPVFLDTDRAA